MYGAFSCIAFTGVARLSKRVPLENKFLILQDFCNLFYFGLFCVFLGQPEDNEELQFGQCHRQGSKRVPEKRGNEPVPNRQLYYFVAGSSRPMSLS